MLRRLSLLVLVPPCLGLRSVPPKTLAAGEQLPSPDFWVCDDPVLTCQPNGSAYAPSHYMGRILERGYARMRDLAAAGRRPLALHIGADGLRNPAKWTDMHLYTTVLSHPGVPNKDLRLAFVEPVEDKAPDFWQHVQHLPVSAKQVSLTTAMMNGECKTPTRSLWKFGERASREFDLNTKIMSGWVSTNPGHPVNVLTWWMDNHMFCGCFGNGSPRCCTGMMKLRNMHNLTDYVEELRVPCLSLAGLLQSLGAEVEDLAMLVVDAEELDTAIIEPLASHPGFRPGFIMWEGPYSPSAGLVRTLLGRGFEVGGKQGGSDMNSADTANTIAVLPERASANREPQ